MERTKDSQKVGYNTAPPITQKYSIVTESMDILTERLSQSLQDQRVC
jgi:hypothetical protein